MAKKGFSLDFDGFLDYAHEVDEMGEGMLKKAVENAFTQSKDYVNGEILKALDKSQYNFDEGKGYSKGRVKKSLKRVSEMPVKWEGNVCKAYIGADLKEAPEMLWVMLGTPHMKKDTNIYNASKVKGNVKKEVERIQMNEFVKVMEENK